ncbi:hypothetical protein [Chimaeribacter arupi]|uniref:hypothetical protein n=1 Tax=Chimaeribacter arupi TaxID=2060066 RepID=UPI002944AF77|nr:hypothetical protein [Chimaeribacter arupi]MDV5140813.1 hypothetical protein [Chimaeribacter arupi]
MSVKALVAIAETEKTYPFTFDKEPQVGDSLTLYVDEEDREFVVTDVMPTGFVNSPPYLYGVCVRPKN